MSRKSKILFVIGAGVVGAITVSFLMERFGGEVQVAFAGAAPNGSPLVYFSITNSFRKPIVYSLEGQMEANGFWPSNKAQLSGTTFRYSNYTGKIPSRAAETIAVKYDGTNRWRFFVLYRDSWSTSGIGRSHALLARQMSRFGWKRLSQWFKPKSGFERVSSQIMLGNNPEAPASP